MSSQTIESHKKRSFERRIIVLYSALSVIALVIVSRLIELQIVRGAEYRDLAQAQHYGGVVLPAKRGEILSRNSKTDEVSIFATNTTLDLLYVDPVVTGDYARIADTLAETLVTEKFDALCRAGLSECPNELIPFYKDAFDPLVTSALLKNLQSGAVLYEQIPISQHENQKIIPTDLPDITEVRRQFARNIEERIREKSVTFAPLLYGANKEQQAKVNELGIGGVYVTEAGLVYANPENVNQSDVHKIARLLSPILVIDQDVISSQLVRRPLRYVPIMSKLPSELSLKIKELKLQSMKDTEKLREEHFAQTGRRSETIIDPYRGVALIAQHWRYYPDTTIGSHVVGFVNAIHEPQYGIERTFDAELRGQEGLLSTVSDPFGGQIASGQQQLVDPRDGDTIVLTIDRNIQDRVEELLDQKVKEVDAESAQAIVMDPKTGRILAMANAPLFDSNSYTSVYEKVPFTLHPDEETQIVVEVFDPTTNARILRAYLPDLTPEGRKNLTEETQSTLNELEKLYDLKKLMRYYKYIGEDNRREIFPTDQPGVWLKYKNNIGVGSYVNRNVQEIYEPGSVMKAVTMAIAIDQGEVTADDTYRDDGPVKVDEYTIRNALNAYYGLVTMTQCIEFSINTCMTTISQKLGRKLFYTELLRFGFGQITGIQLDNELPGEIRPWRQWSKALLSTASYGQGVSATPLQMITAFSALANGGKLMKPTIIDEIRRSDGTVEKRNPVFVEQVIKPETAATMTAILVSSVRNGYAKPGKVPGYRLAGKTGTSQIAGPGGKYTEGTGSTIATFAGYGPVDDPKFVILVKFDRPKTEEFGSLSAAPVFKDIAAFLFDYYGIPPDER